MQREVESAEDPREADVVVDVAVEHIRWMEKQGLKAGTIRNFVTAINTFMGVNKLKGFKIYKDDILVADHARKVV